MKKLVATVVIVLTSMLPIQPVQADQQIYPSYGIDWDLLERWTYAYGYEWQEQSPAVEWLQFWMDIKPKDGIYGRSTHRLHRQAAMERNIPVALYSTVSTDARFNPEVEQWRLTVEGAIISNGGPVSDTARFLSIIACESGGNPDAYNRASTASGLMQHLQNYWDNRARLAGFEGASPFDPVANIYTSAWLIYRATGGGWGHWVCF